MAWRSANAAALTVLAIFLLPLAASRPADAATIQRVVSPGGIEAWLVQDPTLPVISVSFSFKGGSALDPEGKAGLAEFVTGLLDEGAGALESKAFLEALEDIAATLDFEARRDRFAGSLKTLSEHRERAFELLRLAVGAPRFDPAPVERIRAQMIAALDSQKDNPSRIAGQAWYDLVFGKHPYAKPVGGEPKTLRAITREELVRFVRERFVRAGLTIGVAGDISAEELARRLDEVFGGLPAAGPAAELPAAKPAGGKTVVIRKPIPQSIVVFGQRGLKRDDPDYYAAYVMNHILGGGGFSSRLTEEIREKRGLAYSVYSYLNPMDHAGLIMGGLGTANARVATSLDLLRREWRRIAEEGVSEEELAAAKTYLNGSFPLRLDSTRSISSMLVAIQVNKLGIDYLDRRPELIDAVSAADVRRVARRLYDVDALTVVVVGDPEGVESSR